MKIDHLKYPSLNKSKSQAIVLPHPWSLDFLRICSLLLPSPRAVQLPGHHKSTSDRHHYSVYLTLVLLDINHHFARCSTLPMIEFNLKKIEFEGKVCSLTTYLLVHRFNKNWWSSSWLHLTKEIVSKFRRSHSPAHSKKSPPYSILEGASAVSSLATLLRKFERVFFDEKTCSFWEVASIS